MSKSGRNHLLVAAFDFGTTYSGYAYSFNNDPRKIQTNQGWNAGTEKLISLKTPTCVLLNPQKEFAAFGYDAENKYANLAEDNKHKEWMFFRRFKMLLHNNKGLNRSASVEDIQGKKMPAMTIFSMSLRYLRDHLVEALTRQVDGIKETDILYVLTVPAIWSDAAKQFMREAAIQAGFDADRIMLALEPEAASIWCQHINTSIKSDLSKTGSQRMVVDLGGGTADISVHERNSDGTLKEIHRASGGPWGGTSVDQNYIKWLTKLFGREVMWRFQNEEMADYFDILREFETKKRTITSETKGPVYFRVSAALREIHDEVGEKSVNEMLAEMKIKDDVSYRRDKLRVSAYIVRSWFSESIDETVQHVLYLLSEASMKKQTTIIIVGGYGECKLVSDEMKNAITSKKIIVPDECGLAVLKGAVQFGHQPKLITFRVAKYTYGFKVKRVSETDGCKNIIDNVFRKVVEINEVVKIDRRIPAPGQQFLSMDEQSEISIFISSDPNPAFVTDESCSLIGNLHLGQAKSQRRADNEVSVEFLFGETELEVIVRTLSDNCEKKCVVDCL
ncbi:heat shock 70 kDa protein 12A-like isoform X2 [Mya arenaria]|nr:heat shock 70 kDa protein 12A-like isoform X2 [Mya arenaria]XP_052816571.1 heat shock 70 kDa protein 12A-like isoform X2 [Mya arenaria]